MTWKACCYYPPMAKNCRDFQIENNTSKLSNKMYFQINALTLSEVSANLAEKLVATKYYNCKN